VFLWKQRMVEENSVDSVLQEVWMQRGAEASIIEQRKELAQGWATACGLCRPSLVFAELTDVDRFGNKRWRAETWNNHCRSLSGRHKPRLITCYAPLASVFAPAPAFSGAS
jgi:hypothetical protein